MIVRTGKTTALSLIAACASLLMAFPAWAQNFSLSSERLTTLEEPLAANVGGVTVEATGLLRGRIEYDPDDDFDDTDSYRPSFLGNFQISATTQLRNRWNVGVAYFGQYEARSGSDEYTDNIAGFVSGAWGTVVGGEVSDIVRAETRRLRSNGSIDLAFDDALGQLGNWGGGYIGQFGPSRLSGIVDEDGDFDLGFVWQRPFGNVGYRYALRYTHADFTAADGVTMFDTQAATGSFEQAYGQSNFGIGLGYEYLENDVITADRWFATAGWYRQFGLITLLAEGHYGEIDGQAEISGAGELIYDLSRGLSLNLGFSHSEADVETGGVAVLAEGETGATASLRLSF